MTVLLWRNTLRELARHRWQAVLSILGVALGVAVVVAVDLANGSASRAFALSMQAVSGLASHHIIGGPLGFDEGLYRTLKVERGLHLCAPLVEGVVRVRGQSRRLLGIDPLAERTLGRGSAVRGAGNLRRLLTEPDTVLVSSDDARGFGLKIGDQVALQVAGHTRRLTVAGVMSGAGLRAHSDLLVTDIATAQVLLGKLGRLDRIDLRLPDSGPFSAPYLRVMLPAGVHLEAAAARNRAQADLTRAFQTNLSAMSLLALLVGAFLIYNTMTFAVVRRRQLLGTLRVLGVTRRELFTLVLGEALVVGMVGSLLGLGLGVALADGLVKLVTRTINDLYFVLTVRELYLSPLLLLKGVSLGVVMAVLAALVPAREAARTTPHAAQRRSAEESNSRGALPMLTVTALAVSLSGLGMALVPTRSLWLGFAALTVLVLGFSLLVPALVALASNAVAAPMGALFGAVGRLAARGVAASLGRSGVAIAALAVAVSASVGMGVMVSSFRATVDDWLGQALHSDFYVSAPAAVSSRADGTLDEQVLTRVQAVPGVEVTSQRRRVEVSDRDGPVRLLAMDSRAQRPYRLAEGDPAVAWRDFRRGEAVLISEPYAYHRQLRVGDSLTLRTDHGPRGFKVGGIIYHYGSDRGLILMGLDLYRRNWNDLYLSSLGVSLTPGTDRSVAATALREALAGLPQAVQVQDSGSVRRLSLAIFDRTFAVTEVLRLLAVGVAFVGVLSALMALQLERAREHAILRATGLTPGGLFRLVGLQTGLMGLAAGVLAVPLGLLMSQLLIQVVNRRAFGWSIATEVEPQLLWQAVLLALLAALLAGLYPAWRMARVRPALALREE